MVASREKFQVSQKNTWRLETQVMESESIRHGSILLFP